jgi:hypothetical protein
MQWREASSGELCGEEMAQKTAEENRGELQLPGQAQNYRPSLAFGANSSQ